VSYQQEIVWGYFIMGRPIQKNRFYESIHSYNCSYFMYSDSAIRSCINCSRK